MKNESARKRLALPILALAVLLSAFVPFAVLTDAADADDSGVDATYYRYSINFQNTSTDYLYIIWDFADGTVLDGRWTYYAQLESAGTELTSEQSAGLQAYKTLLAEHGGDLEAPTHTYKTAGTYKYSVTAINPLGFVPEGSENAYDGVLYTDFSTFDGGLAANVTVSTYNDSDRSASGAWNTDYRTIDVKGYPTITFQSNGGSDVAQMTVENTNVYTAASEPEAPTKTGSVFGGWYTDAELTQSYDWSSLVTEPITLYAKWIDSSNAVTVKFVNWDKTVISSVGYSVGDTINAPATDPVREPTAGEVFTFLGWYNGTEAFTAGTKATADVTYTAEYTYKVRTYTVTFAADGNTVATKQVDYNTAIAEFPEAPAKEGYKFIAWTGYTEGTPVTSDLTLTAYYEKETKVTVKIDGKDTEVDANTPVSELQKPTKDGYTFKGWYSDEALTKEVLGDTFVTSGMTLYAKFVKNTVTVTVDGKSVTMDEGKTVADLTVPTKEGYTFKGWYSDEAFTDEKIGSTVLTDGMTLYSKYTQNTAPAQACKVILLDKDGNEITSFYVTAGKTLERTDVASKVTSAKHLFKGLYTDPEMKNEFDFKTEITADTSLYVDETVSLDPNDEDNDIVPIALLVVGILLLFVGIRIHPAVCVLGLVIAIAGGLDFLGFIDF